MRIGIQTHPNSIPYVILFHDSSTLKLGADPRSSVIGFLTIRVSPTSASVIGGPMSNYTGYVRSAESEKAIPLTTMRLTVFADDDF